MNKHTIPDRYICPKSDPMGHFFKITNAEENHKGYQYVDGLNVLREDFRLNGSCVPGGLYFTNAKHIYKYLTYGIYLRDITLPHTDSDLKMVKDESGGKWRANKIILGKRYDLSQIETHEYLISKGADEESACEQMVQIAKKETNFDLIKSLWKKYNILSETVHQVMVEIAWKEESLELTKLLIEEGVSEERTENIILTIMIKKKDWAAVKSLLKKDSNPTQEEVRSICESLDMELINFMLDNVVRFFTYATHLFSVAIRDECIDLVKLCIDRQFNCCGYHGDAALYVLAVKGNLDIFKYLVENGARHRCNNEKPLHLASKFGHLDLVKYLVESGSNVQANDNKAIRTAIKHNHCEIVKFLLEKGAKLMYITNEQLISAIENGSLNELKYLRNKSINPKNFILAIKNGSLDEVEFLIKKGINPKINCEEPLRIACEKGHLEIVKFLVSNGSNIRAICNDAIYRAVCANQLEIVKFLHEQGAKIRIRDDLLLITAAEKGYMEMVKFLVENGADPLTRGRLAMRRASENGHTEVVAYLTSC